METTFSADQPKPQLIRTLGNERKFGETELCCPDCKYEFTVTNDDTFVFRGITGFDTFGAHSMFLVTCPQCETEFEFETNDDARHWHGIVTYCSACKRGTPMTLNLSRGKIGEVYRSGFAWQSSCCNCGSHIELNFRDPNNPYRKDYGRYFDSHD